LNNIYKILKSGGYFMLGFRFRPVLENIDFMIQGVGITFFYLY